MAKAEGIWLVPQRYEAVRDHFGWELREWRDKVPNQLAPAAKGQTYESRFFGTLMQCCEYVLDREAGLCTSVERVMDRWDEVLKQVRGAVSRVHVS